MAKSSWLTVSPTSGFGNKTIQNIGTTHTGRLQRQTVVTGRAIGIATTKTYTVTQKAKAEFIMIGAESYSVAAAGGIVTISGTSNSPKLTVSVGNGGTLGALRVNGSTATNGSAISGDPGATAQYNWSVQIQVGENLTAVQRNIAVTVTGSSSSVSDTAKIVQAASVFEYTFNIAAGTASLPASGGNSAITAQLTTKRNGKVIGTRAVTPTLSGSATGFSISGTTVTAANRGTTLGNARSIVVTGKFTTSETGEVLSDTVTVSQEKNIPVSGTATAGFSYPSGAISAAGGSKYPVIAGNLTLVFTSGASLSGANRNPPSGCTTTPVRSYSMTSATGFSINTSTGVVTAADRATTTGGVRYSGNVSSTLTYTITISDTYGGGSFKSSGTETLTTPVSQQANSATYGAVTLNASNPATVAATGGTATISASASQTVSFTSGDTRPGSVSIAYAQKAAVSGFSLSGNKVTVAANNSTSARSYVVTVTATGEGSKSASKEVTVSQAAGARTYSAITLSVSYPTIPAKGGTVTPTVTYSQTWGWNGATTGGGTITSGGTVAYSGTNVSVSNGQVSASSKGTTLSNATTVTTATVSVSLNGKSASKSVAVTQEKNIPVSGTATAGFSYPSGAISAAGGSKYPVIAGNLTLVFTSGASLSGANRNPPSGCTTTPVRSYSMTSATGFSINTSTGVVTAADRATTTGGVRYSGNVSSTLTYTITISDTYGGGSFKSSGTETLTTPVSQQANSATYGAVTISGGSVSDIPASGGSVSSMSGISASQTVSFTSESTRPGSVSISYSTKVQAGSLGTTVKNRASVGTLTATATGEGSKSATKSLTVYQAGNYVKSVDLTGFAIAYSKSVSAAGGTVSPSVTQGSVKFTFTSGSTSTSTPSSTYGSLASSITYSGSAANGFSAPNSSSGAMTVPGRGTTEGAARNSGTVTATKKVTWTHASSYSGGGTKTDSMSDTDYATQKANSATYTISLSANRYTTSSSPCPASGGTATISCSGSISYTSGSKGSFTPSISIQSAVSGASLSGTTLTWASRGTTVGNVRSVIVQATYSGATTKTVTIYQQANSRTEVSRVISVSAPTGDIPAKGGSVTITRSGVINYSFTSGSTDTGSFTPSLAVSGTGFSISGTTVTAASRGTTVGERRSATVTASYSGATSKTVSVYQEANERKTGSISYGSWKVSVSANRYIAPSSYCPASGGTATISSSASRTRTQNYSYTSGATSTSALSNESATPTLSISSGSSGASLSGNIVTFPSKGTTITGIDNVTVFASHGGESAWVVLSQEANSRESTQLRCRYTTLDSVTSLDDFETCVLSDVGGDWEETSTGIDIPPFKIHSINSFSQPTFYFTFERCYSYTSGETSSWEIVPSADISFPTQDDFTEIVRDERMSFVSWVGHYSPWADFSSKTYVYFKCNIDNLVGASSDLIWLTMGYNRTDYKYVLAYATTPTPTRPTTYFELTSATTGEIQFPTMLGSAQGSMYFYFFALDDVTNDYSIISFNKPILATLSPTLKGSVTRTVTYVRMTYNANRGTTPTVFGITISGEANFGSDAYCPFTFDSVSITFQQKAA